MLENDFEIKDKQKVISAIKNKIKKTPMFNGKILYKCGCLHIGKVYQYYCPLFGYASFNEFVVLDFKSKDGNENTLCDTIIKIFGERVDSCLNPDDYLKVSQQHATIAVYDKTMFDAMVWACRAQFMRRTVILLKKIVMAYMKFVKPVILGNIK